MRQAHKRTKSQGTAKHQLFSHMQLHNMPTQSLFTSMTGLSYLVRTPRHGAAQTIYAPPPIPIRSTAWHGTGRLPPPPAVLHLDMSAKPPQ